MPPRGRQKTLIEFHTEHHVTNEKLSYALKHLGVMQTSCFYWKPYVATLGKDARREVALTPHTYAVKIDPSSETNMQPCSAFLSSEIMMILPEILKGKSEEHPFHRLTVEKVPIGWNVSYLCVNCGGADFQIVGNHLPDVLGEALHVLIKQKKLILTHQL